MSMILQLQQKTADSMKLVHTNNIIQYLHHMRLLGQNTDTTLICKEDKELKAHILVLSAASEYFRNRMGTTNAFFFMQFDVESMTIVVEFLYTGTLVFDPNTNDACTREVLDIGRNLQIQFLVDKSLHQLAKDISYLELYRLAQEYNSPEVISSIVTSLAVDFLRLVKTDEILHWDVEIMKGVLQKLKLEKASLDDIVGGILRWYLFDPIREKELASLVKLLDLHRLSDDYLDAFLMCGQVHDLQVVNLFQREKIARMENRLNERTGNGQQPVQRFCNILQTSWIPKLSRCGFGDPH